MPYKSLAQERYFNANRSKMEAQGVDIDEWNKASKGMKLPKKAKKSAPKSHEEKLAGAKDFAEFRGMRRKHMAEH